MLFYKNKINCILLGILILLLLFSQSILAQNEIENLHFQNTDIKKVLRMIGEVAGINLVIEGNVEGNITIHLRNISFKRGLDLITRTQGLTYKWDENTVVVASPERINYMYSQIKTEIIEVNHAHLTSLSNIISTVYPDLVIDIYKDNRQIILKGKNKSIKEVKNIIKEIDVFKEKKEIKVEEKNTEKILHIIKINSSQLQNFQRNIKIFFPEIKVGLNPSTREIILFGDKKIINKAADLVKKMDYFPQKDNKKTEIVKIKYKKLEYIKKNLKEIYEKLEVKMDEAHDRIILKGEETVVNKGCLLAKKLDKKNYKKLVTEIIQLNYLKNELVENILEKFHNQIKYQSDINHRNIIIKGRENEIEKVKQILEKLDKPQPQVRIDAKIEEVSRSELKEIGISPSKLNQIKFIKKSSLASLPEFFKMLEEKGKARILANPSLMTLNGETGKLLIGDKIPVEVSQDTEDGEEKKIKYIEAGIILEFKPWITEEGKIKLEIIPQINSVGEFRNGMPTINTREVSTTIRLEDEQTFLIGGLLQENIIKTVNKVPVLADLPILGELFKSESEDRKQTEIIIIITPKIIY